eukprot:2327033-Rhodomonas_salina.1
MRAVQKRLQCTGRFVPRASSDAPNGTRVPRTYTRVQSHLRNHVRGRHPDLYALGSLLLPRPPNGPGQSPSLS